MPLTSVRLTEKNNDNNDINYSRIDKENNCNNDNQNIGNDDIQNSDINNTISTFLYINLNYDRQSSCNSNSDEKKQ